MCGIIRQQAESRVHGHRGRVGGKRITSPTYQTWVDMRRRCRPGSRKAKYWGDRGITVCERWSKFENFLADMGEKPPGLTIERLDVNGHYEPGNCAWIPQSEQPKNRRPRST